MNENGEHLAESCAERGMFLANTFFQHKVIHRYKWRREDGEDDRCMIDYIAVDERLRKDVLDAKVVRRALEGSDHYAVVVKFMLRGKWEFCRKIGKEKKRKLLANERLGKEDVRQEYRRKLSERLRGAKTRVRGEMNVSDMYGLFKGTVMEMADEVLGWREGKGKKRGSAWWTNKIRDAVEGKKSI